MYRADRFSVIGAVAYSPVTEPASDHAVRSPDSEMRHCAEQPRTTTSETALSVPRSITAPVAEAPDTNDLVKSPLVSEHAALKGPMPLAVTAAHAAPRETGAPALPGTLTDPDRYVKSTVVPEAGPLPRATTPPQPFPSSRTRPPSGAPSWATAASPT